MGGSQSISIGGATQRTFVSPGRKWTQMQGMPLSSADAAEKLGAGVDFFVDLSHVCQLDMDVVKRYR